MTNELEITVRFSETDAMGIVYHANYYVWFEMGRYDFLDKFCQKSTNEIRWGKYYLPVVHVECDYIESIKFGDIIVVSTYMVKTDVAKLRFVSEIRKKGSGKIVAKGYTEHVFLEDNYKMMISLPDFIKEDITLIEQTYPEYLLEKR